MGTDDIYFEIPVLPGVELEGWRLGLYTNSIDVDATAGDAYLVAPDGRRCGLVWRIAQPSWFVSLIGPNEHRFGTFEVACAHGPTSTHEARRFIAELLPDVRREWERSGRT